MDETSIYYLLDFFVNKLPKVFIDFTNFFFTPIKEVLGAEVWNGIITALNIGTFSDPFLQFVVNNVLIPIGNFGLIGIISTTTILLILILKLIDLIIPI